MWHFKSLLRMDKLNEMGTIVIAVFFQTDGIEPVSIDRIK